MSDWRDHTNGMTVAERAAAMCPLGRYSQELVAISRADLLAFGQACTGADLERRRAVEAERDALAETAARLRAALEYIERRCQVKAPFVKRMVDDDAYTVEPDAEAVAIFGPDNVYIEVDPISCGLRLGKWLKGGAR